ncbi:MAG: DUF3310 domain-containing protein [Cetobacterium sp.]|uniref:DUF3310 domain-containing protein n=1 Tax=Cetobacterium sp. TaxID=2071632 RepID=UPI003EE7CEB6
MSICDICKNRNIFEEECINSAPVLEGSVAKSCHNFEPVKDEVEDRTGHYTKGKIEPFMVYKSMGIHSDVCKSNIIKYALRQGKKLGEEMKDLKKIVDYGISLAIYEGVDPQELRELLENRIKKEKEQNEKI